MIIELTALSVLGARLFHALDTEFAKFVAPPAMSSAAALTRFATGSHHSWPFMSTIFMGLSLV